MRLIDSDALIEKLCETTIFIKDGEVFQRMINDAPTVQADRPTGEWVTLERDENVYDIYGVPTWGVNYMCDKCGFITTAIQDHFGQYKFCPNCGAKMTKGGDDHEAVSGGNK